MIQQGQVFKLKARGADGRPLWAQRYRLDGRGSARPQVGSFASRAEAEEAAAEGARASSTRNFAVRSSTDPRVHRAERRTSH